jgi:hypothetical protein
VQPLLGLVEPPAVGRGVGPYLVQLSGQPLLGGRHGIAGRGERGEGGVPLGRGGRSQPCRLGRRLGRGLGDLNGARPLGLGPAFGGLGTVPLRRGCRFGRGFGCGPRQLGLLGTELRIGAARPVLVAVALVLRGRGLCLGDQPLGLLGQLLGAFLPTTVLGSLPVRIVGAGRGVRQLGLHALLHRRQRGRHVAQRFEQALGLLTEPGGHPVQRDRSVAERLA